MIYRATNRSCFTCGSQVPSEIECLRNGPAVEYECPTCGDNVLTGIVTRGTDREISPIRPPGRVPEHACTLPRSIAYGVWELWWTDQLYVVLMHGRQIAGNEHLAEFVNEVNEIYDG